jgi:hypothetical protein
MARIQRSIATLSWIDPVTGLPEVDKAGDPGPTIIRAQILGKKGYRFSNFLEAWIEVDTKDVIIACGFSTDSDMYRGPSYLNTESAPVGNIGRKTLRQQKSVTFRQLVGCRTMAPEKIGQTTGRVVGRLAAGPVGEYVGGRLGRSTAEAAKVFPPIWTELELTINADHTFSHAFPNCSLFPSVSYYALDENTWAYSRQGPSYNAVPMLDTWYDKGWGPATLTPFAPRPTPGNPWSMTKPTFTTESKLTPVPQGY